MAGEETQALHISEPRDRSKKHGPCGCDTYHCYKYILLAYAILFLIVGIICLVAGIWGSIIKQNYHSVNDFLSSPATLAIIIGVVVIITAILGIVGVIKEHVTLVKIFLGIIIIVLIIQVIVGILAFVYREEIANSELTTNQLHFAIEKYEKRDEVTKAVDSLQQKVGKSAKNQLKFALDKYAYDDSVTYAVNQIQVKLKCCGIDNYGDWDKNEALGCKGNGTCSVPDSCCKEIVEDCGKNVRQNYRSSADAGLRSTIYVNGCKTQFRNWVETHLDIVGAIVLGFALPQVLGILITWLYKVKLEDRQFLYKYRPELFT
ncbi:unnamed protein product [Owenia fusiformis]|uniref:Uncharacterized protein n=1 Tax=Owenia fusiformis TaxID=6347 RepID=A0A8J1U3J8_OWEFU|nr:unnamed protein product [Owenia fusiformis]